MCAVCLDFFSPLTEKAMLSGLGPLLFPYVSQYTLLLLCVYFFVCVFANFY